MKYLLIIQLLMISCNIQDKNNVKPVLSQYKEFYKNGKLKILSSKKGDLFEGEFMAFHLNGNIASKGVYINGKMDGIWKNYFPNGAKLSITECDNGKIINYNSWSEKGYEQVINGNGVDTTFYDNGQVRIITPYMNNKINGEVVSWFENEVKSSSITVVLGKPAGTWKFWNKNGELLRTEKH